MRQVPHGVDRSSLTAPGRETLGGVQVAFADPRKQLEIIERGTEAIIPRQELLEKLELRGRRTARSG